jgi:3-oxoadipate enol-lactonase
MRTLVLCGSLGSTHEMWEPQLPALSARFAPDLEVVRIDHPGHGGAPLGDVHEVEDLARRVLETVEADSFSFVGLSLGGAVGMQLALSAPERLDRLVLCCTAARFGDPELWVERAALVRAEGVEAVVDLVLPRWFSPGFPDLPRYRAMFLSTDPEGYAHCCEALARWDAREDVARIAAPTLVVSGADDPYPPAEYGALLAERIPGARYEVIPGARHLANVEHADEFNRLLLEHL